MFSMKTIRRQFILADKSIIFYLQLSIYSFGHHFDNVTHFYMFHTPLISFHFESFFFLRFLFVSIT